MIQTETKDAEGKQPAAADMVKETTVKDDGRFLYYYSFPVKDDTSVETKSEAKNV